MLRSFVAALICVFIALPAFGQVPDGSLFWVESSALDTGVHLDRWKDKSGRGNDAIMEDFTRQPEVILDASGVKSVQFLWGQYLELPSIFPTLSDYTIVAVVRLHDTSAVSNILSGDHRAYWFESKPQPAIAHDDRFDQKGVSELKVRDGYNILIAEYREATGMAIHYLNGQFGDSLFVDSNHDSTLYIASYARGYFANCNMAEIMLYPRVLTDAERTTLESSLFTKYNLSEPAPLPGVDPTFTEIPKHMQLYPRGSDDSATVPINGAIYLAGFDRIAVATYRDGELISNATQTLQYQDGKASFSFTPRIKSELKNYDFEVSLRRGSFDTLIARREKIVAGDVYIIGGASNATFGAWTWTNQNEFCRTYGVNVSRNPRDTVWTMSQVDPWGLGPSVSGWGATIQQLIAEKHKIPTAIINWAVGGTILVHHLKKPGDKHDLRSIYGRLLYRLDKGGLRDGVKAHIFWHGELHNPEGYSEEFRALFDSIAADIPSLKKTYQMQLRPSYCSNLGNMPLREFQRKIQDSIQGLETIATAAMPNYDGCHYTDDGWRSAGTRIFQMIERDFYGGTDTNFLRSPTLTRAYFKNGKYNEINLEFAPKDYEIQISSDGTFEGVKASIRDYIFLDTTWGKVVGITAVGNRVVLHLSEPVEAKTISYLPDRYYHGTEIIYRGPWLTTQAGVGVLAFQNVPLEMKLGVEQKDNSRLLIHPNPSSDFVQLSGSLNGGEVEIQIFDLHGRSVAKETLAALGARIDHRIATSALAQGIYTIRVRNDVTEQYLKLIVTR